MRLLIGDCRPQYFKHSKAEDRRVAVAFLERSDVEVRNWYKKRGGASEAHLKVWIAYDVPRPAVLSGSANLTHQGLLRNTEMVTEIAAAEVDEAVERVEDLFAKAWNVKKRLLDYINPADGTASRTSGRIASPLSDVESGRPDNDSGRLSVEWAAAPSSIPPDPARGYLVITERETESRKPTRWRQRVIVPWSWKIVSVLAFAGLSVVLVVLGTRWFCGQAQWLCDGIRSGLSGG